MKHLRFILLAAFLAFTPLRASVPQEPPTAVDILGASTLARFEAQSSMVASMLVAYGYPTPALYFQGRAYAFHQVAANTALTALAPTYRQLAQMENLYRGLAELDGFVEAALAFRGHADVYNQIADLLGEPPLEDI